MCVCMCVYKLETCRRSIESTTVFIMVKMINE